MSVETPDPALPTRSPGEGWNASASLAGVRAWLPLLGWFALFTMLFVLYPRTGAGIATTERWSDQQLFLKALTDTLGTGSSSLFASGMVGPGYVALAALLVRGLHLSAAASLVALAEISFVATGFLLQAFVFRLAANLGPAPRNGLMLVATLVPFSSVWAFAADIPWTHFTETALLAALVLGLAVRPKRMQGHAAIGALLMLVYQTRGFEGGVVLIALALAGALRLALAWRSGVPAARLARVAGPALGLVIGAVAACSVIGLLTGVALPYAQYNDDQTLKLAFGLFPIKLVQLFLDTCYMTVCPVAHSAPTSIFGVDPALAAWRQPLLLQLPALAAAGLTIPFLVIADRSARRTLFEPPVLVALLTAGGVALAYTSAVPSGAPHLQYGFMRDYLAPMILAVMAIMAMLARTIEAGETHGWRAALPSALFVTLVIAGMLARPLGGNLPVGQAIQKAAYTAQCAGDLCRFDMAATSQAGEPVPLPALTVAIETCGGADQVSIVPLGSIVLDRARCSQIRLLPAATGLVDTPNGFAAVGQPFAAAPGSRD